MRLAMKKRRDTAKQRGGRQVHDNDDSEDTHFNVLLMVTEFRSTDLCFVLIKPMMLFHRWYTGVRNQLCRMVLIRPL